MDDRLLDAAVAILDEHGFTGLTLERVAESAGKSRVTLWRQGVTQEALIDGLLARLTRDYRDAMWPAMAEAGTGAQRLREALAALLGVADRHLHLLAASSDVFTRAAHRVRDITGRAFSFLDPFTSAVRAGAADGTLRPPRGDRPDFDDVAEALFHTTVWGYVQLRHRQGWPAERARPPVLALALKALDLESVEGG